MNKALVAGWKKLNSHNNFTPQVPNAVLSPSTIQYFRQLFVKPSPNIKFQYCFSGLGDVTNESSSCNATTTAGKGVKSQTINHNN